jgi:beta-glucanase (GH16 family)
MATQLSPEQTQQIEAALAKGDPVSAIALYRSFTGTRLKEAQGVIAELAAELIRRDPERYAPSPRSAGGCASVLALALGLVVSGLVVWLQRSALMVAMLSLAGCSSLRSAQAGEAASLLPELPAGQSWQLAWHDEFHGTQLDASKWESPEYERRGHLWRAANATVDGHGNAILETSKVGERFASPCLRTRGTYEKAFGFFEVRCRLPTEPGHWPAFWLFCDAVGKVGDEGRDGTEIDIMEWPHRDGRVQLALHWDGYGKEHKSEGKVVTRPALLDGQFHHFALWWTPAEYVFYIDGEEVWRTTAGGVCQVPVYLKLSVEIGSWAGDITKASLPDRFVVDYVRVYDVVGK